MHKTPIRLDTVTDVKKFVEIAEGIAFPIMVKDNSGHCVSGKSLMGMLYSLEWSEIYYECDVDIYNKMQQFII